MKLLLALTLLAGVALAKEQASLRAEGGACTAGGGECRNGKRCCLNVLPNGKGKSLAAWTLKQLKLKCVDAEDSCAPEGATVAPNAFKLCGCEAANKAPGAYVPSDDSAKRGQLGLGHNRPAPKTPAGPKQVHAIAMPQPVETEDPRFDIPRIAFEQEYTHRIGLIKKNGKWMSGEEIKDGMSIYDDGDWVLSTDNVGNDLLSAADFEGEQGKAFKSLYKDVVQSCAAKPCPYEPTADTSGFISPESPESDSEKWSEKMAAARASHARTDIDELKIGFGIIEIKTQGIWKMSTEVLTRAHKKLALMLGIIQQHCHSKNRYQTRIVKKDAPAPWDHAGFFVSNGKWKDGTTLIHASDAADQSADAVKGVWVSMPTCAEQKPKTQVTIDIPLRAFAPGGAGGSIFMRKNVHVSAQRGNTIVAWKAAMETEGTSHRGAYTR